MSPSKQSCCSIYKCVLQAPDCKTLQNTIAQRATHAPKAILLQHIKCVLLQALDCKTWQNTKAQHTNTRQKQSCCTARFTMRFTSAGLQDLAKYNNTTHKHPTPKYSRSNGVRNPWLARPYRNNAQTRVKAILLIFSHFQRINLVPSHSHSQSHYHSHLISSDPSLLIFMCISPFSSDPSHLCYSVLSV